MPILYGSIYILVLMLMLMIMLVFVIVLTYVDMLPKLVYRNYFGGSLSFGANTVGNALGSVSG